MPCTLKDVMNLEVMNPAHVHTAVSALPERQVESVSVIEMPVENFVRKHDFVLSTAMGCSKDIHVFKDFVQEVMDSEASALAIATGRHIKAIPDEILQVAQQNQFPIIEIPWQVRFADITHAILSKLNEWQQTSLQRSEEIQKKLLHLFLREASLSDVAEVISSAIDCPVLIADREGFIKGKSSHADELREKWQPYFWNHIVPELRNQQPAEQPVQSWARLLEGPMIQLEIRSANKTHGYLITSLSAWTPSESFPTQGQESVLEHAVTVIALWFQREQAIQETEMRLRGDFVWSLAQGEMESWDLILSRAKTLNLNVTRPYICILGFPENLKSLFQKNKASRLSYDQWLESMVSCMEKRLKHAADTMQRLIMITYHRDRFVIFLEVPLNQINQTVHLFLDRAESGLQKLLPGLVVSWGIGGNHAGVRSFQNSFHDARIALEIGTRQKSPGHRHTYANTGIYRILVQLAEIPELQKTTLSTIGPLMEHDQKRGLDLIHTLMAYIQNKSNVSQTSRSLNLHRQSLLYRLRKIESLTGRSLVDPDDLFLLDLSIRLWMTGMMDGERDGNG